MNFHRNFLISIEVIDEIATDLIEVCNNTSNKDQYRLNMMTNRFKHLMNCSALITVEDINRFTECFRSSTLSAHQLSKIANKLSKSIDSHYKTLCTIFKGVN